MGAFTPIFHIPYPTATDKPKDAAAHFQGIAVGVEAALQAASVPPVTPAAVMVAASAAARDAYWGAPATSADRLALQARGATTIRTDTGWTERYFAAYNASSNPAGTFSPGWYPVEGKMPLLTRYRSTAEGLPTNTLAPLQLDVLYGQDSPFITYVSATGIFTVLIAGIYEVIASADFAAATDSARRIIRIVNSASTPFVETAMPGINGATTGLSTSAHLPLTAGSTITLQVLSATAGSTLVPGYGSVRYVRPY